MTKEQAQRFDALKAKIKSLIESELPTPTDRAEFCEFFNDGDELYDWQDEFESQADDTDDDESGVEPEDE